MFKGKIFLAPMAGITDSVFRKLCKSYGADITVTEMVSSEGLHYNSKTTENLFKFDNSERPIGVQIFGSSPEKMSEAAKYIEDKVHPDFIDINSGCPVPKVVRNNGGSALLKNPKLFGKIINTVSSAISVPLTVKIRSGWNNDEWIDCEFGKIAEESGASAITLHPRSKTMLFSGSALWSRIKKLKETVTIPVIGNGDIFTPDDAKRMMDETGCDSIMIARGVYGAPWIFSQTKALINNGSYESIQLTEKVNVSKKHMRMYIEEYGENKTAKDIKKHLAWYLKGVPNATYVRNSIFRSESVHELKNILKSVEKI